MKRIAIPVFAVSAIVGLMAIAGEMKSGLQIGDRAGAFNVKDCTGPAQGKAPLCYR